MRRLLGLGPHPPAALRRRAGRRRPRPEGRDRPRAAPLRRLPEPHDRRYVSIFGELTIARVVYGTREGQKIERVPLDERLGLPEGDFSYVLEDWGQRLCLKESFAEAGRVAGDAPGAAAGVPDAGADEPGRGGLRPVVPGRRSSRRPPPRRGRCWSSPPTARGCRCAARRRTAPSPTTAATKGEKANKKQMACVGAVYSIEPFVRKADDILDEVLRDEKAKDRPEPQHKHVWAEMTREVEGEPLDGQGRGCSASCPTSWRPATRARPPGDLPDGRRAGAVGRPAGLLPRGGRACWTCSTSWSGSGRWPTASTRRGATRPKEFVEERLRDLLQGRVGYVIGGLAAAVDQAGSSSGREAEGGGVGDGVPGEQPGAHAVRRVPGGGLPDRQRGGRGGVPPSGQGPDGADGDAVDGGGGAGDAPRPGVVPERPVGGVPGVPGRARSKTRLYGRNAA